MNIRLEKAKTKNAADEKIKNLRLSSKKRKTIRIRQINAE